MKEKKSHHWCSLTTLPPKSFDCSLLDSTHACVSSNHGFISTVKYRCFQNHPKGTTHEYGNCNVCQNTNPSTLDAVYEACPKSIRLYFFPEKPVMAGWQI
jgi:hypothetical protein